MSSRRSWSGEGKKTDSIANHKWVKPNDKIEEKNAFSRQPRITQKDLPEDEKYEIDEDAVMKEVDAMYDNSIEEMEKHMNGKKV